MIRTLIIEDEHKNRLRLRRMIEEHFHNISLVGEADGVETGIKAINEFKPDLVLLDIKLIDGDAFELLERIGKITFKIIFITAYEEYALKAIKFSALDYLLKPMVVEELKIALDKAEHQILHDLRTQLSTLQLNLQSPKNKIIVLKTLDKVYLVEILEIIRCESDGHYTRIFTREGKQYMVSNPLKEYEEILEEHGFFRIHKSHMVNLSYIDNFDKEGYVNLKDDTSLPVARRKKNELLEKFSML
jgi:two-component system LytT family response regulator